MRRGRILMLSDYVGHDGSSTGGAGIAALDSYQALRDAGVAIRLVTGFGLPEALKVDPNANSLGGTDLRGTSPTHAIRTIHNPASAAALRPLLAEHDPEDTIIILHQWTRYLSPSVIAILRRYRVMIYMHDYFWACPNGAYFDFTRSRPCDRQPMGLSCLTSRCDRNGNAHKLVRVARHVQRGSAAKGFDHQRLYLHVSNKAKQIGQRLMPLGQHATLYNPMGLSNIDLAARHPASLPKHDIGYFGRLEPEKGIGKMVTSLARRGMTGLFVGEGSLATTIETTPGMTCLPWQPRAQMAGLMRRCRVIALPSLWPETWGLVTAEAMAAGVPVLVSSRAGSAELVERFGGGFICDPASDTAFDDVMNLIASGADIVPVPPSSRMALQDLLSPQKHAERIVRLAARTWEIDLASPTDASPFSLTASG